MLIINILTERLKLNVIKLVFNKFQPGFKILFSQKLNNFHVKSGVNSTN